MDEGKKKLLSADGELMRALGITDEDIAANDAGTITPNQQDTVRQSGSYQDAGSVILGTIFSGIGGIALTAAIISLFTPPIDLEAFIGISIFGLIFGVIGFSALRSRGSLRKTIETDIAQNRIATMQGIAVVTSGDSDTSGYFEVNDQRFKASENVVKRVQHLEPYLVYYLEESKVVIAMQRLDTENDNLKDEAVNRLSDADDEAQYRSQSQ